ncbi:metal-binding protein [Geminocystis herdmanii]|uniref:metal-binding protein n=1 Tax=Geminocystis herdmanii TaxID=669359 RepID=UPI00034661B1|nr:metal-binding protein [Geminocystis herdmanii]
MPSGKTHDRITWYSLPLVIILFAIITRQLDLTLLASIGFIFSGLMFGPDLDIYSVQFQRWGVLRFIWLPYQKKLKHRSIISHGFIIGTIVRILYLSLILFILAIFFVAIAQLILGFSWHWQKFIVYGITIVKNQYWQEVLSLFIGLELGAMSHYLADNIGSWWKSKNKPTKNRQKSVRKNPRRVKTKK